MPFPYALPSPPSYTPCITWSVIWWLCRIIWRLTRCFFVGHDWGSFIACWFCQIRHDMIKAMVSLGVVFSPRNPTRRPLQSLRVAFWLWLLHVQVSGDLFFFVFRFGTFRIWWWICVCCVQSWYPIGLVGLMWWCYFVYLPWLGWFHYKSAILKFNESKYLFHIY